MLCFHKYGIVQEDGYQYCSKCGVAKVAECSHIWHTIEDGKLQKRDGYDPEKWILIGNFSVCKCSKCGKLKRDEVVINRMQLERF